MYVNCWTRLCPHLTGARSDRASQALSRAGFQVTYEDLVPRWCRVLLDLVLMGSVREIGSAAVLRMVAAATTFSVLCP